MSKATELGRHLRNEKGLSWESGAPCTTRTCDLLVRSQTLYPTELRARKDRIIHWEGRFGHNRLVSVLDRNDPASSPAESALLTISDSRTLETDTSGATILGLLESHGHRVVDRRIAPDEPGVLTETVREWCGQPSLRLIITTGGTGIAKRDSTYDALHGLFHRELPGFGELFRKLSFDEIGAAAMLTRAAAGTIDRKAIFLLPGSEHAVRLDITRLILPQLGHLLRELAK